MTIWSFAPRMPIAWLNGSLREEAMLVSPSAAAALVGCLQVASSLGRENGAVIVTIFPDAAEKYLSERFWDEY